MKAKKLLTVTGDVKTIFKLQDINLSLDNFWRFFRIWKEVLPKNDTITRTFLLGAFWKITLGVYNLLRNHLTHSVFSIHSVKFGG